MSISLPQPSSADWTVADLHRQLGSVPLERIRMNPAPGTATAECLTELEIQTDRLYELVDGSLVEKTMGYLEGRVAFVLGVLLEAYLSQHDLGIANGPDGSCRIFPDQVRIPDVSFVSWERLPNRKVPDQPVPQLVPDLAVEVLSRGNTVEEMERKLRDYFRAGVRLVWYIDPRNKTARSYSGPEQHVEVGVHGRLNGGDVLPGFEVSLGDLFDRALRGS